MKSWRGLLNKHVFTALGNVYEGNTYHIIWYMSNVFRYKFIWHTKRSSDRQTDRRLDMKSLDDALAGPWWPRLTGTIQKRVASALEIPQQHSTWLTEITAGFSSCIFQTLKIMYVNQRKQEVLNHSGVCDYVTTKNLRNLPKFRGRCVGIWRQGNDGRHGHFRKISQRGTKRRSRSTFTVQR